MIDLNDISKRYRTGRKEVRALDAVSLEVRAGEFVVLRGPSGSGKTTLLLVAGGMLHPTSGRVLAVEKDVYGLGERARAAFRAAHIGFVFQMYCLLPYLNVLENVLLAAQDRPARERAGKLLDGMGLQARLGHRPAELSAGERQRVACVRALVNNPQIILADEPTGNLDEENALRIHGLLADFCHRGGTVLMVTHGSNAEDFADRTVYLRDGRILSGQSTASHS
jgi:ABC-type lipoprotein export system ATPase subunit